MKAVGKIELAHSGGTKRIVTLDNPIRVFRLEDDDRPDMVDCNALVEFTEGDQFAKTTSRDIIKTVHPQDGSAHYWELDENQADMPEGFVKAWPIGGGFAKRIPRSHVTEWNTKIPEVYKLVRLELGSELYHKDFRAWVNPLKSWNGWAIPYVDEENLRRFIEEQDKLDKENPGCGYTTGRLEGKTFVVKGQDGDPDYRIEPETIIVPDGRNVEVWDINLGLTWDAIETPEDPEGKNDARAGRVGQCLELYRKLAHDEGEPDEAVIKDFLCDLGHFCDRSGSMDHETIFECWGSASMNYEAETGNTGKQFDVI